MAGLTAGSGAVLTMHPLDLLKIKFQVSTTPPTGWIGRSITQALMDIYKVSGVQGLYRGLGTNIAGNASSWGLYFLMFAPFAPQYFTYSCTDSYTYLKDRKSKESHEQLSPREFLICSAQASEVFFTRCFNYKQ